jgi:hypothetical protein
MRGAQIAADRGMTEKIQVRGPKQCVAVQYVRMQISRLVSFQLLPELITLLLNMQAGNMQGDTTNPPNQRSLLFESRLGLELEQGSIMESGGSWST